MLSRRQFFARMRKLGFSKSRMQMTRIGLTYVRDDENGRVTVTVPKHHESTFTILGDTQNSGIFVQDIGKDINWGVPVNPNAIGLNNMLEVCLGLCSGDITLQRHEAV